MMFKPARTCRLVLFALIVGLLVLSCNLPAQLTGAATPTVEMPAEDMMGTAVAATLQAAVTNTPQPPDEPTAEPPIATVTATLTLTPTIVHITQPGEPPNRESWMFDSDSSTTAGERRASRGEYYQINFLERPFNANSMDTYFPDLDIKEASLARGGGWVYVTIKLVGQRSGGGLQGTYGAELDLNLDGRGDWLILATAPGGAWSTERVKVFQDSNHDVGDGSPNQSDPPQNGDGYETLVFDQGLGSDPDAAWARVALQGRGNVVMVRVNDDALRHLDMLVDAEITKSRSESAAFLINEGIKANQAVYDKIAQVTDQIAELRQQLRESVKPDIE